MINVGRPNLYTTTTQRGGCIEASVSILVQSQSEKSLPGGGGVHNVVSHNVSHLNSPAPKRGSANGIQAVLVLLLPM